MKERGRNQASLPGVLGAWPTALAVALCGALSHGREAPWELEFSYRHPRRIVLDHAVDGLTYYWYIIYTVKNPNGRAHPLGVRLWIETDGRDRFEEGLYPEAERAIFEAIGRGYPNFFRVPSTIEPEQSFEVISIFQNIKPDAKKVSIYVKGLIKPRVVEISSEYLIYEEYLKRFEYDFPGPIYKPPANLVFRSTRTLIKECEVDLSRLPTREELERMRREIEETFRQAMELTQQTTGAVEAEKPTPEVGVVVRRQSAYLVEVVDRAAQAALSHDSFRVEFEETLELAGGRIHCEGTIMFKAPDLLRVEMTKPLGLGRELKELRIYDGQRLWIKTETEAGGPIVRKIERSQIAPRWTQVGGYPNVGLREIMNPAFCWLAAADDVVRIERKEEEGVYCVLYVEGSGRGAERLKSPIAPSFLSFLPRGKADVKLSLKTGLPKRIRIEAAGGRFRVTVSFGEPELDIELPRSLFTMQIPEGVEVLEMGQE